MNINQIYPRLFQALCTNNLSTLLEEIYQIFNFPISLVDVDYNVLGLLPNQKLGDPLWDSMLTHQTVTYDMVQLLHIWNYQKDLDLHSDLLYIDYGIGKDIPRTACVCKNKNQILGYICILYTPQTQPVIPDEILHLITDSVSLCMLKNKETIFSMRKNADNFAYNLFTDKITDQDSLEQWITSAQLNFSAPYIVLCCETKAHSNTIVYLKQLKNMLQKKSKNHYIALIDHTMYILCTNISTPDPVSYIHSQTPLIQPIIDFGFSIGVSNIFQNLLQIKLFQYEAQRLLSLNPKDTHKIYYYKAERLHDIFSYPGKIYQTLGYRNEQLLMLEKHDRLNNTDYFLTLKTYLYSFGDSKKTIEKLNIHRNTLLYRLHKIEQLTGYLLSDSNVCINLLCDLYLLN